VGGGVGGAGGGRETEGGRGGGRDIEGERQRQRQRQRERESEREREREEGRLRRGGDGGRKVDGETEGGGASEWAITCTCFSGFLLSHLGGSCG
jgi:hypothetical protein